MEKFSQILLMSFVTISIYDIIKGFYRDNKVDINNIVTAILGIILSIAAQLDAFALVGINFSIPFLGSILTGLVISKGSNYVYDFITKLISLLSGNTIQTVKIAKVEEVEEEKIESK